MKRSAQMRVGVWSAAAAILLAACGTSDGAGEAATAAPVVTESQSPSRAPAAVSPAPSVSFESPSAAAGPPKDWRREACLNAVFAADPVTPDDRAFDDCEYPLGDIWVQERAGRDLPAVEPDLYAKHQAILGQPRERAGEQVSLYVYVPGNAPETCPDEFSGQILLGLKEAKSRKTKPPLGENGGDWFLYPKSQLVRFVVDGPVDGDCDSRGDLYKQLVRVEATVLDEPAPTFRVQSLQGVINLTDEVRY